MIWVFVASNIAITLAYMVLGFYVSPRFAIVGAPRQVSIAKYALFGFFAFCAVTHVEQAVHVLTQPRAEVQWMLSYHMVISHLLQALCAPAAAYLTVRFLQISIVPNSRIIERRESDQ